MSSSEAGVEMKTPAKGSIPFEDALDLTGVGRYNYTLFAVSTVLLLASAVDTFGTSFVVTAGGCDLRLTTETKGIVSAMPMLGIVLSSHLWGWLADTRGRRPVLLASMWGTLLVAAVGSFARNWVEMACAKCLSTFFASAGNSVTYALLGESSPRAARARLVLLISTGLMFSQGFMVFIAYPILHLDFDIELAPGLHYRPWRLLHQTYALLAGLAALLMLLFIRESPKFHASRGDTGESIRVMEHMFRVNSGRKAEEFAVTSLEVDPADSSTYSHGNVLQSMWRQTAPMFRRPYLWKTLTMLYVVVVVYGIAPAFLMWTPTVTSAWARAADRRGSFCTMIAAPNATMNATCIDTVEDVSYAATLAFATYISALHVCNTLAARALGSRAVLVAVHVFGGACGLLMPLVEHATFSLVLFYLFQTNVVAMGITTGLTVEIYPTYMRAMAVCLTMMVGRGSSFVVASSAGSLLLEHCDAAFYGFGAVVLTGAVAGALLPADRKPK